MNFTDGILIIGQGAIGRALAEKCQTEKIKTITVSRSQYDMTQEKDVQCFFAQLKNIPKVIVNTIGILHDENHFPEKSLKSFTSEWFFESLRINTLPCMWIAKCLQEKLQRQDDLLFVTLSARVASISDNRLGGWYSYRSSKCALNMLIKNISIEWSRHFKHSAIYAYHPGTVDSKLSEPFKKNVKPEKLFSPTQAANYLFTQLKKSDVSMSGQLIDWRGTILDY